MRASIATFLLTWFTLSQSLIMQSPAEVTVEAKCGTGWCPPCERCAGFLETKLQTTTIPTTVVSVKTVVATIYQCRPLGFPCCGRTCLDGTNCVNCSCV